MGATHLEGGDRKPTWETVLALCQAPGVDCGEFAREPAALPEPRTETKPKRPRKEQALQLGLHATESAPGPTLTKKGRAGKLPEPQEKPKGRKARRPQG